ncbi:unnamed protein product [Symbiodinium natans]|uniref:Uncharacterized protein n=1 Tax=Symbiodinium natans TaxID=878477 RepID=A0A812MEI5_9DINO|nr:unnamed protein product [Symbiodinium natans]
MQDRTGKVRPGWTKSTINDATPSFEKLRVESELPVSQASRTGGHGPRVPELKASMDVAICAKLFGSDNSSKRRKSIARSAEPTRVMERAKGALPELKKSKAGAETSGRAKLRNSTALSECARSETDGMKPERPPPGVSSKGSGWEQDCKGKAEPDFKESGAGEEASDLPKLLVDGVDPNLARSRANSGKPERPQVGTDGVGAKRPMERSSIAKPRCRKSRTDDALPS